MKNSTMKKPFVRSNVKLDAQGMREKAVVVIPNSFLEPIIKSLVSAAKEARPEFSADRSPASPPRMFGGKTQAGSPSGAGLEPPGMQGEGPAGPLFELDGWFGEDDPRELRYEGVRVLLDRREFAVLLILALLKLTRAGLTCPWKILGPAFLAGKLILDKFERLKKETCGLGGIWQRFDAAYVHRLKYRLNDKMKKARQRQDPTTKESELILKGERGGYALNVSADQIKINLHSSSRPIPNYVSPDETS
jgi:hypothetical protein